MKKVIIHGHFYQPPRENPWTGILEDQKEASPYSNWNKRICRECYEANAYSPLLDAGGKVRKYFNNYAHMSFNAGPTLLSWLEQEAPHVYEKILEGDRISRGTRGSGNAIAQVYNHIILPLATERDRRTQILWSLEDFKNRFGRDTRGLWLSETAICPETAEEMVKNGIDYTILSPHQAERFIFDTPGMNIEVNFEELWRHPWTLDCPSGELRVYFYHPGLSSGISFNHLLRDADNLYKIIKSELKDSEILPVATDGEIYGHHEALGNMGLSAVLAKIEADPDLESVNFSQLSDSLPSAGQVILKKGEDRRGSSWSCSHGVSRWYKDCGCTTGSAEGWNQSWRTPLRDAFNALSIQAERVFKEEINKISPGTDPDGLRDAYISVLNGRAKAVDFLNQQGISGENTEKRVLRLLEGQKYAMYMFTSCGWFFADITGVEPRQNLLYAARLFELYDGLLPPRTEEEFLTTLSRAHSNLPDRINGADLYRKDLEKRGSGLFRTAATLILEKIYGLPSHRGNLIIVDSSALARTEKENLTRLTATVTLKDMHTAFLRTVSFTVTEDRISFTDIKLTIDKQSRSIALQDLSSEEQKTLLHSFTAKHRHPDPSILPGLMRRFNGGSDSITAAAYSALREILILMEGGDGESWSTFKELLSTELLREIPLPAGFTEQLYGVLENALSSRDEKKGADISEQILKTLPQLSLPAEVPKINATLGGRIYDLYVSTEEGKKILSRLIEVEKQRLNSLLQLSENIAL